MKQGIAQSTIIYIILIIISAIILFMLLNPILKFIYNYQQGGMCQATATYSSLKKEFLCLDIVKSPVSLHCDKKHLDIGKTQTQLVINGKKNPLEIYDPSSKTIYTSYLEFNEKVVDSILADQLYNCWKQFGKGESIIFNQASSSLAGFLEGNENTACFVCSEIYFKDVSKINLDLYNYLSMNIPRGHEETYLAQLNSEKVICEDDFSKNGNCWSSVRKDFVIDKKQVSTSMTTDDDYAVVMVRKRFDVCQQDKVNPKDADFTLFPYVVKIDDLEKLCTAFIS